MKETNAYLEAKRYVSNARKILTENAGKKGDYYSDPKYVKMACNTAYQGILVALDEALQIKKNGKRVHVEKYEELLSKENKTMLKHFNSAYNYLHLFGGYDGDLKVTTSKTGLELAEKIIDWSKQKILRSN